MTKELSESLHKAIKDYVDHSSDYPHTNGFHIHTSDETPPLAWFGVVGHIDHFTKDMKENFSVTVDPVTGTADDEREQMFNGYINESASPDVEASITLLKEKTHQNKLHNIDTIVQSTFKKLAHDLNHQGSDQNIELSKRAQEAISQYLPTLTQSITSTKESKVTVPTHLPTDHKARTPRDLIEAGPGNTTSFEQQK